MSAEPVEVLVRRVLNDPGAWVARRWEPAESLAEWQVRALLHTGLVDIDPSAPHCDTTAVAPCALCWSEEDRMAAEYPSDCEGRRPEHALFGDCCHARPAPAPATDAAVADDRCSFDPDGDPDEDCFVCFGDENPRRAPGGAG